MLRTFESNMLTAIRTQITTQFNIEVLGVGWLLTYLDSVIFRYQLTLGISALVPEADGSLLITQLLPNAGLKFDVHYYKSPAPANEVWLDIETNT